MFKWAQHSVTTTTCILISVQLLHNYYITTTTCRLISVPESFCWCSCVMWLKSVFSDSSLLIWVLRSAHDCCSVSFSNVSWLTASRNEVTSLLISSFWSSTENTSVSTSLMIRRIKKQTNQCISNVTAGKNRPISASVITQQIKTHQLAHLK